MLEGGWKIYEGGRQFDTRDELISAINDTWRNMPAQIVDNLFESIPKRLVEVMENQEKPTKY